MSSQHMCPHTSQVENGVPSRRLYGNQRTLHIHHSQTPAPGTIDQLGVTFTPENPTGKERIIKLKTIHYYCEDVADRMERDRTIVG